MQGLLRVVLDGIFDRVPALLDHFQEGKEGFERFCDGHIQLHTADAEHSWADMCEFAQIVDGIQQFLPHLGHIELERVDNEGIEKTGLNRIGYALMPCDVRLSLRL